MKPLAPIRDRLLAGICVDESGCWIWTGAKRNRSYGSIGRGPRGAGSLYTHRVAYELFRGPIPAGMDIDHLCRVQSCCNPEHLQAVSRSENLRRGQSHGAIPGHRLSPETRSKISAARRRVPTSPEIGGR